MVCPVLDLGGLSISAAATCGSEVAWPLPLGRTSPTLSRVQSPPTNSERAIWFLGGTCDLVKSWRIWLSIVPFGRARRPVAPQARRRYRRGLGTPRGGVRALPLKPTWRSKVHDKTFPICRNSRRSAASATSVGAKLSCQGHLRDRQSGSLRGFLLVPAARLEVPTGHLGGHQQGVLGGLRKRTKRCLNQPIQGNHDTRLKATVTQRSSTKRRLARCPLALGPVGRFARPDDPSAADFVGASCRTTNSETSHAV
jgi:hypothetical protein